jgi:hypothetical protein
MVANLSVEEAPVRAETVLDLCRMTPLERFELLRRHDGADELIDELGNEYERFLEVTQRPNDELLERFTKPSERKDALVRAEAYGDLIYRLLMQVVPRDRVRSLVV